MPVYSSSLFRNVDMQLLNVYITEHKLVTAVQSYNFF
jgi:hypothetical protein